MGPQLLLDPGLLGKPVGSGLDGEIQCACASGDRRATCRLEQTDIIRIQGGANDLLKKPNLQSPAASDQLILR